MSAHSSLALALARTSSVTPKSTAAARRHLKRAATQGRLLGQAELLKLGQVSSQCYRWRTLINISRSKKAEMLLKCVEVSEIFTIYIFLFQFRRFLHSSGLSQLDFLYRVEQVR